MQSTSPPGRPSHLGVLVAAVVLAIFGIAAVAQGLEGRSTVHSGLRQEAIVGAPHMTPAAIAPMAKEAALRVDLPTCSVAGEPVHDGATARCFAEYMRIDALLATGGVTYAQMPAFATDDGKGTNNPARARKGPKGRPLQNPARDVWITEVALSTALNSSYMAERISLFGIAVGAAFLLVGLVFAVVSIANMRRARSG